MFNLKGPQGQNPRTICGPRTTIRTVGVRGEPCGAMRWTVYGWSQVECLPDFNRTPSTRIAATTPRSIVRILNPVFLKSFKNFKLFSNFNEVQTYSLMMIC